jgi:hypothetical protein
VYKPENPMFAYNWTSFFSLNPKYREEKKSQGGVHTTNTGHPFYQMGLSFCYASMIFY